MLYAILKPLCWILGRLYFRVERHGEEHIPRTGALLLVANHSSFLDPPIVGAVAPRPLSFLAKAELFKVPILGTLIRNLNARPLKRDAADPSALRLALKMLEEERALLIFPEGTRGPEGVLREPKTGAGMLAVMSGAPVVPVCVSGTGRAWPKGRRWPGPAKVRVTFGPALRFDQPAGRRRKEAYVAASRAMMNAIAGMIESHEKDAHRESEKPMMRTTAEPAEGAV